MNVNLNDNTLSNILCSYLYTHVKWLIFVYSQVFQHRVDGSQDLQLNWNEYKQGFGCRNHEFWLGNDKIHYLTNKKRNEIRIDLVNRDGAPYYAKFDFFRINDESDNYRLSGLGDYSGTAGLYFYLKTKLT